jgi:hypothetical protein
MCKIIITTPIMNKQIRHAITIKAKELVGLMKSSRVQLLTFYSGANMISWELGIIGVHTLIDLSPSIE